MMRRGNTSKHWVNAYLMSLCMVAWVLLGIGGGIYTYITCHGSVALNGAERTVKWLVYFLPCGVFGVVCVMKSYEFFGRVTMLDDRLVLTAPLRKTMVYEVSAIRHIRIDDGLLDTGKQYWVVISTAPIPARYMHKVNQMPITHTRLKMVYTPALDQQLERWLTGGLYKEYSRAKSILRACHEG